MQQRGCIAEQPSAMGKLTPFQSGELQKEIISTYPLLRSCASAGRLVRSPARCAVCLFARVSGTKTPDGCCCQGKMNSNGLKERMNYCSRAREVSDGGEEQSQNHTENSWRFSNRNRLFLYNSESNGLFQYCSKEVGV